MATVYRVVTLRADGSMVGFDGPFHSPGTAKRVLRTVSAGLSSSNPSGGVKAEIQSLTGEWERIPSREPKNQPVGPFGIKIDNFPLGG